MPAAKRAVQDLAGAAPVKRAKTVVSPTTSAALELLEEVMVSCNQELPEDVKKMLRAIVPYSLAVPCEQRDNSQERVVSMVASLVEASQANLEQIVNEQEDSLNKLSNSKESLVSDVKEKEEELTSARSLTASKDSVVEATKLDEQKCKEKLKEAMSDKEASFKAVEKLRSMQSALMNGVEVHFKALSDGDFSSAGAKKHLDVVIPLLKSLGFEDSLLGALPAACMKDKVSRGTFDTTVLEQVEANMNAKIAELGTQLESQEQECGVKEAIEGDSRQNLQVATEAVKEAIAARDQAMAAQQETQQHLTAAIAAVDSFAPNLKASTEALKLKEAALERFKTHHMSNWSFLSSGRRAEKVEQLPATRESIAEIGGA